MLWKLAGLAKANSRRCGTKGSGGRIVSGADTWYAEGEVARDVVCKRVSDVKPMGNGVFAHRFDLYAPPESERDDAEDCLPALRPRRRAGG